jgi:hypothetical protein
MEAVHPEFCREMGIRWAALKSPTGGVLWPETGEHGFERDWRAGSSSDRPRRASHPRRCEVLPRIPWFGLTASSPPMLPLRQRRRADLRGVRGRPKARRSYSFSRSPPAGERKDPLFRPERYMPALSPVAKTRPHVGDLEPQGVADGDEGKGMVGIVAGEPPFDLGDELAGGTVLREGVALERVERVPDHRDGQDLLRAYLTARPVREAVHVLVGVIEHASVVTSGPARQNASSCARKLLYVDLRMPRLLSSDGDSSRPQATWFAGNPMRPASGIGRSSPREVQQNIDTES